MPTKLLAVVLGALLLAAPSGPLRADPPDECRPFASETAPPAVLAQRLVRLCALLVQAQGGRGLSDEETVAAERLGRYLAVLAKLELGVMREGDAVRLRVMRRTSPATRYLIADRLGLIALADRLAPAV